MPDAFSLPDWNALASADDAGMPLFGTALLVARDEYPQLDPGLYDRLVQDHAEALRAEIASIDETPLKMHAINRHLFEELGYSGNTTEYYDPRNSYLNEVFERRLDVPLSGVSVPGHFLVRLAVGDEGVLVMDPFNRGRPLDVDELRDRATPHLGGTAPDDNALTRILDPASNRAMLVRLSIGWPLTRWSMTLSASSRAARRAASQWPARVRMVGFSSRPSWRMRSSARLKPRQVRA